MNKVLIKKKKLSLRSRFSRKVLLPLKWWAKGLNHNASVRLRKRSEVLTRLEKVEKNLQKAERLNKRKETEQLRGQLESLKWMTHGLTEEETK